MNRSVDSSLPDFDGASSSQVADARAWSDHSPMVCPVRARRCGSILEMRHVSYPTRGRPDGVAGERDELVMLLQASIEIANAERWALEIGDAPAPPTLQQNLRRSAYEVTVVDVLHRVARRYFAQQNYRAVWERPFHTGNRGRPESVDICLFRNGIAAVGDSPAVPGKEVRLELGLYSATKLRADCSKLARLAPTLLDGFPVLENLVLLWEVEEQPLIKATSREALATYGRCRIGLQERA